MSLSGSMYKHFWTQIGKDKIWEDNEVKLLGITIDNSLILSLKNLILT